MSDLPENLKPRTLPAQPHIPVLRDEVLAALRPQPGKLYVDATLGAGGHAEALLAQISARMQEGAMNAASETSAARNAAGPQLIGIDQDPAALAIARERLARFGEGVRLIQGNFSRITALLSSAGLHSGFEQSAPQLAIAPLPGATQGEPLAGLITGGVLADIGVSSMQLDQGERGFSFSKPAPLDMRMSPETGKTAADVLNGYPETELVRIFSEYGEEHLSKTIARAIAERRTAHPLQTTTDLAELVAALYRQRGKHEKIHPATRVFQALRIEVNDELGSLRRFLAQLPALLAPGARVAIISFHSLEDRIVKRFFQDESRDCLCPPRLPVCQCGHKATLKLPGSKPITAGADEIRRNPRARSAKLRVAERL